MCLLSGGVLALIAALSNVARYIPSSVTTVLSFRSGVLGSLRDNRGFHVYRFAQDSSTVLFGSSIWGLFVSSIVIWFIVFALGYGYCYPVSIFCRI